MTTRTNKTPTLDEYLTCEEFRARFDAEKTEVQRHYCTLFQFWRSCRRKPCRRARACKGDAHQCLKLSVDRVPRDGQFHARQKLLQATPRNIAAPERAARDIMPNGFGDSSGCFRPRDIPRGWTRPGERRGGRGAKR